VPRTNLGRQVGTALVALVLLVPTTGNNGQDVAAPQSGLNIEINLPAFRLDVRADTQVVRSFPVAVGMRGYPTPTGDFTIAEVEWNPWWRPPDSYWARNDTVTPPGPRNPMGKVKMPFGRALYLHGTPVPSSIGRAASHACVRMHNADAITLGKMVQAYAGADLSDAGTDSILRRWRPTRLVKLPAPVPLRIVYRLVELQGDELVIYPDVYKRGSDRVEADALALLAAAGFDTATVDRALLRRAASAAVRSPARVTIPRLQSALRR
jgi:murein L,D-transpeptidase YcbB/YkuD